MKLSDYIWKYIKSQGINHVFMFSGGGAMHLVDSLGKSEIKHIPMFHEQACAMAAETYARISNNMGAVLVTTGPGGTNAITGVAAAWLESTPVVIISGQAKTSDLKEGYGVRQRGNQELGIVDIVSSITKYAVMIKDPNSVKYHLDKAFYEAKAGRPGPVWIDIPLDIQAAEIIDSELESFDPKEIKTEPDRFQIERVINLINQSKRPVIIAGQGIERGNGCQQFKELVDKLGVPVLLSWIASELLPYNHPLNIGKPGMVAPRYSNFTMQDSDLVIAIGTRLDPAMIGYTSSDFAPNAKKIIVDIDANELNKFEFEIDEKINADATQFINSLLNNINSIRISEEVYKWVEHCKRLKEKYPIVLEEYSKDNGKINPYYYIDKLSELLNEEDVVIPGSSGAGIDIFWLAFKNKAQQRALATGALGSMGYGIPAAIGAYFASGKRVVCVEGDGSFQLNIQELATIAGNKLPIKIFINENGGYLSIINMQKGHFDGHFVGANSESKLFLPDIVNIAKAYGFETLEIFRHDEIEEVINEVLSSDSPSVCVVHLDKNVPIQPKVMSRVLPNGSMESGKLRNLWPFMEDEES